MPTSAREPAIKDRRFDSLQQEAYLALWRTYDRLRMMVAGCCLSYEKPWWASSCCALLNPPYGLLEIWPLL